MVESCTAVAAKTTEHSIVANARRSIVRGDSIRAALGWVLLKYCLVAADILGVVCDGRPLERHGAAAGVQLCKPGAAR